MPLISKSSCLYILEQESQEDIAHQHEVFKNTIQEAEMFHTAQMQKLKEQFEKSMDCEKLNLKKLSEQYNLIRSRFENRESRHEDILKIKRLEESLEIKEKESKERANQMNQLRNEMLLREDNYNKHFRNGGKADKVLNVESAMASTKGLTDWLVSSKKRQPVKSGKARARRETD